MRSVRPDRTCGRPRSGPPPSLRFDARPGAGRPLFLCRSPPFGPDTHSCPESLCPPARGNPKGLPSRAISGGFHPKDRQNCLGKAGHSCLIPARRDERPGHPLRERELLSLRDLDHSERSVLLGGYLARADALLGRYPQFRAVELIHDKGVGLRRHAHHPYLPCPCSPCRCAPRADAPSTDIRGRRGRLYRGSA